MHKVALSLIVVSFLLLACMLFSVPTQGGTGGLSGQLSYPSEAIPPLRVVAFDTNTENFYYVETGYNQSSYQITGLPAGSYHVVAYTLGGGSFPAGLAGGYTQATLCGLTENCTDHTLVPVEVSAGQEASNINPSDWFAGEGAFPVMPGPAPSEGAGSLTGALSYPSEYIPPLRVFAFQVGTQNYYYVDTVENQMTYQIDNLPAGYYTVVAYTLDGNFAGGYSQAVPCGLSVECTDHSLIEVPVNSGQTVTGVDPGDWYAPEGTFPPPPVLP